MPGGGVTRLTSSTIPLVAGELTSETMRMFDADFELLEQLIGPPVSVAHEPADTTV